ncbi:ribose ABC transporter permease [Faecalicatena orotica]|uniref:Autoinducer 2 import system permease protein LsrD n=1 Tax=Faecalicatena orotica TaxID=1544 RepID=A0A2Y9BI70_9FIRM|nr:ABC transporter permease [Faecalicatena orotica]PWJ27774.1 ribose transport system permease protein [Faecalicatena orotica]SSA57305.1 ribose transport system permease protein [Faecalicatena orotica]
MKEKKKIVASNSFTNYFRRNLGSLIGLAALSIIIGVIAPKLFSGTNLLNLLKSNSVNAIISCAMLMAILLGEIDISVGSTVGLAGVVSASLITDFGMPVGVAVLVSLLVGVVIGIINGMSIAYFKVPAFIATLATQCIGRGLTQVISGGISIRVRNDAFSNIAMTNIGGVSVIIIYAVIFLLITWLLLNKTKFGYYIYAIGGNRQAAEYSGINVKLFNALPYVFSGIACAFCGILWTARLGSAAAMLGNGFELDAISAVVIGGTSMSGGVGTVGGTVLGILIIGVLQNGLNLMGVNSFWQYVCKGIIILLAVIIDVIRKSKEN